MKSQEIRAQFLKFFEGKNHQVVPSAPMVVKYDPSLMLSMQVWFLSKTTSLVMPRHQA